MATIELATSIAAPIDRVFDLARSIDLHTNSTSSTGERQLLRPVGSYLFWAGGYLASKHFGVWSLSRFALPFERPTHFADAMLPVRSAAWSIYHY
jgi:hypothetical protein